MIWTKLLLMKKIISLNISQLSYSETTDEIMRLAKKKEPSYICFANVHMTIEAYDNSSFADIVNNANIVCADGMPIVFANKILYKNTIERVAGMDMVPTILKESEETKLSVFFYGTSSEILKATENKIQIEFPTLKVAGYFSPPFREITENEKQEHIDIINKSSANIVFVALGCPKQEKWMAENSKFINATLLGIGGALPVFAGVQERAPEWMRKMSLEWFYRLYQDPKRLFKRYLYTNSKFIYLLIINFLWRK
jgi:N-acetylglucosaminyldiphosphoundecaprenol N-acetyl-beta-D-mannosaminyltransferase